MVPEKVAYIWTDANIQVERSMDEKHKEVTAPTSIEKDFGVTTKSCGNHGATWIEKARFQTFNLKKHAVYLNCRNQEA